MEDLTTNPNLILDKTIEVEFGVTGTANTTQRVDLRIDGIPPLNIEYKWLASSTGISKETFIREFVLRDLFNANSLSEFNGE